jgi:hypothetical protein
MGDLFYDLPAANLESNDILSYKLLNSTAFGQFSALQQQVGILIIIITCIWNQKKEKERERDICKEFNNMVHPFIIKKECILIQTASLFNSHFTVHLLFICLFL